jgi:hypothetical protein
VETCRGQGIERKSRNTFVLYLKICPGASLMSRNVFVLNWSCKVPGLPLMGIYSYRSFKYWVE